MIRAAAVALVLSIAPVQAQRLSDAAPVVFFDQSAVSDGDYGLVCPSGNAVELPAPGTHLGVIKQREGWQKIEYTTQVIPMVNGIGFGVEAAPLQDLTGVQVTVFHPPYPGTNVTEESWISDFSTDAQNLSFFTFEFPFELVEGRWAIQATHRGNILYAVEFDVVPASRFPDIDGLCPANSSTHEVIKRKRRWSMRSCT